MAVRATGSRPTTRSSPVRKRNRPASPIHVPPALPDIDVFESDPADRSDSLDLSVGRLTKRSRPEDASPAPEASVKTVPPPSLKTLSDQVVRMLEDAFDQWGPQWKSVPKEHKETLKQATNLTPQMLGKYFTNVGPPSLHLSPVPPSLTINHLQRKKSLLPGPDASPAASSSTHTTTTTTNNAVFPSTSTSTACPAESSGSVVDASPPIALQSLFGLPYSTELSSTKVAHQHEEPNGPPVVQATDPNVKEEADPLAGPSQLDMVVATVDPPIEEPIAVGLPPLDTSDTSVRFEDGHLTRRTAPTLLDLVHPAATGSGSQDVADVHDTIAEPVDPAPPVGSDTFEPPELPSLELNEEEVGQPAAESSTGPVERLPYVSSSTDTCAPAPLCESSRPAVILPIDFHLAHSTSPGPPPQTMSSSTALQDASLQDASLRPGLSYATQEGPLSVQSGLYSPVSVPVAHPSFAIPNAPLSSVQQDQTSEQPQQAYPAQPSSSLCETYPDERGVAAWSHRSVAAPPLPIGNANGILMSTGPSYGAPPPPPLPPMETKVQGVGAYATPGPWGWSPVASTSQGQTRPLVEARTRSGSQSVLQSFASPPRTVRNHHALAAGGIVNDVVVPAGPPSSSRENETYQNEGSARMTQPQQHSLAVAAALSPRTDMDLMRRQLQHTMARWVDEGPGDVMFWQCARIAIGQWMQERTFEPDGSMPDLIVYFCRSRSELVYLFVYQRLCLFRLRIALTSVGAFDCLVDGETGRARVEVRLKRSNGIAFERRIRQPAIPWHRTLDFTEAQASTVGLHILDICDGARAYQSFRSLAVYLPVLQTVPTFFRLVEKKRDTPIVSSHLMTPTSIGHSTLAGLAQASTAVAPAGVPLSNVLSSAAQTDGHGHDQHASPSTRPTGGILGSPVTLAGPLRPAASPDQTLLPVSTLPTPSSTAGTPVAIPHPDQQQQNGLWSPSAYTQLRVHPLARFGPAWYEDTVEQGPASMDEQTGTQGRQVGGV